MEVPILSHSRHRGSYLKPPVRISQAGTGRARNDTNLSSFFCNLGCRLAIASLQRAFCPRATQFTVLCQGRHPLPPSQKNPSLQEPPSAPQKRSSGRKEPGNDRFRERIPAPAPLVGGARGGAAASRRRRPGLQTRSPAEIEEEAARKRAEARERKAMEEANGFRVSKRSKRSPEEFQLLVKLNMCSKHGHLRGALDIYDKVRTGELFDFKQHHYNILLYICSGAASGSIVKGKSGKTLGASEASDRTPPSENHVEDRSEHAFKIEGENIKDMEVITFSSDEMQLAARRGMEIYADMVQSEIPPNEATFTAVARLAVAKGDGDLAFETVKKMSAAGMVPKLRTYGPALLCFCEHNQVEKAFEVDDHMVAAGVLPDEHLLEAMIRLCIAAGLEAKVYILLQRLRKTVREVLPSTVTTIEKWFNSEPAASAGSDGGKSSPSTSPSEDVIRKEIECRGGGWHGLGWLGRGKWKTTRTTISRTGVCQSCGETLCSIDLDPEETDKFAKSVAELAMQRERNPNEFVTFQEWLEKNGGFEAVMDGANIGMYNSSFRGFNYNQVVTVADSLKTRNLTSKPPLVVLHRRRVSDKGSRSPRSQKIIDSWVNGNTLYSTPHGSNDDWYWLYAAVKCKCLLVTNDEMRDHLFELLGKNFFPKWKERHQVRFTFSSNGLDLLMPPPYSTIMQESQVGSWHVPQSGGDDSDSSPREWLCVTRSSTMHLKSSPLPASEQKSDIEMVSSVESGQVAGDLNLISSQQEELSDFFSQAIKEEPALSDLSETLQKLEAAERASMSVINFEI